MILKASKPSHIPVLLKETIQALAVQPGGRYIDCTLGGGGHAEAILENSSPGGQLLGIDADPEAIKAATTRLKPFHSSTLLVNENFANLEAICLKYDFFPVHGILFDLGLSSLQLSNTGRGFSFQQDALLDMRYSPDQELTAADIINTSPENELARLIYTYGEDSHSRRIAHQIIKERPIETTLQLARTIEKAIGNTRGKIHPATKTFQALRIVVNQELEHLKIALKQAIKLLGFEGKLVTISYHSLEDRIVKELMHQEAKDCICPPNTPICICGHRSCLSLINKKVIKPSPTEIQINPRSRSAKLRAAERTITLDEYYKSTEKLCSLIDENTVGWKKPVMLAKIRKVSSTL
jgi:16S rRNA (cytosine1402-N4)-methyltransferase